MDAYYTVDRTLAAPTRTTTQRAALHHFLDHLWYPVHARWWQRWDDEQGWADLMPPADSASHIS